MHVDAGKYSRILFRTFGIELDHAVLDRFSALFEDVNNVEG
jgi:hypothetical protein